MSRTTVGKVLAASLRDAGTRVVTHVPGHGATETFAATCELMGVPFSVSYHEEVACAIAHGASLVGTRSVVLLKSHGVAKAANCLLDALFAGTTAGLVLLVFDDRHGRHSDCIFDIDAFLTGLGMPFERIDEDRAPVAVSTAFNRSERLGLPVALVVEAEVVDRDAAYSTTPSDMSGKRYARDIARHLVCPLFAGYQRRVLDAKLNGDDVDDIERPAIPVIPGSMPSIWQSAIASYTPFFTAFRELRGDIVTGDTGISSLFALPPFDCVDLTTYMGGSIPLAVGACLAGARNVWAVTGDFSFIAAGHLGLIEASERGVPLKTVIFVNGRAEATGGQPVSSRALGRLLRGYEEYVRSIPAGAPPENIREVVAEVARSPELRILLVECPAP